MSKGANTNILSSNDKSKNPKINYDKILLDIKDLTDNIGNISQNHVIAENGIVNFSMNISGLSVKQNVATPIIRLPEGFRPSNYGVNGFAFDNVNSNYNHIVTWINTGGYLSIHPNNIAINSNQNILLMFTYNI